MTKKEFRNLYNQIYVTCLNYRLQEALEANKIKLKIKAKQRGREFVLEELDNESQVYEPEHCFYYDSEEIHRHAQIDTEDFLNKLYGHFLTEDFKEYEYYKTDPKLLKEYETSKKTKK